MVGAPFSRRREGQQPIGDMLDAPRHTPPAAPRPPGEPDRAPSARGGERDPDPMPIFPKFGRVWEIYAIKSRDWLSGLDFVGEFEKGGCHFAGLVEVHVGASGFAASSSDGDDD